MRAMLALSLVTARLRDACPSIRFVAGAAELASATSSGLPTHPAAFVFPLAEAAGINGRSTGPALQQMVESFAVLLAVKSAADPRGEAAVDDLRALRLELRAALHGWEPDTDHAPLVLAGAQMVSAANSFVFWQEEFATEYLAEGTQ